MYCFHHKKELEENGYSIVGKVYSDKEIDQMISCIENAESVDESFMRSENLFAIRQLIKHIPQLKVLVFNEQLKALLSSLFDQAFFLSKAIYFDKPSESNWFVAYHQDLSISVKTKKEVPGYGNWTFKKGQYGVQPPQQILDDTVTVRVHLDKTTKHNGALKVIPKSHLKGIIRSESKDWNIQQETICEVEKGGLMLMKPLTFHASTRTTNGQRRRVIHLEFNQHALAQDLKWLEYQNIFE